MTEHLEGYATNRRRNKDVVRVITELPTRLVEDVDRWGVSAGMTSRREATETLLRKALEVVTHEAT